MDEEQRRLWENTPAAACQAIQPRTKTKGAAKRFRAFEVKCAYKIHRGQEDQEADGAGGQRPKGRDGSARPGGFTTCRRGLHHRGGSQACWEGCQRLETPAALTLALSYLLVPQLAHRALGLQRKMHSEAEAQIGRRRTARTQSPAPSASPAESPAESALK